MWNTRSLYSRGSMNYRIRNLKEGWWVEDEKYFKWGSLEWGNQLQWFFFNTQIFEEFFVIHITLLSQLLHITCRITHMTLMYDGLSTLFVERAGIHEFEFFLNSGDDQLGTLLFRYSSRYAVCTKTYCI